MNTSWFSPDKLEKDSLIDAIKLASKYAKGDLLDAGCGNMPYKLLFFKKVMKYQGLDLKDADIIGSVLDIPKKDASYDTILSTQVIEHVTDPAKMMIEFYRVLKPNGYVILTAPLFWCLHEEPQDYFRFTKYSLKMLFENAGFKIIYIRERGNWAITIGQMISLFLEPSFNKYLLKYPKRTIQAFVQFIFYLIAQVPIFNKIKQAPLGYIVVAKK